MQRHQNKSFRWLWAATNGQWSNCAISIVGSCSSHLKQMNSGILKDHWQVTRFRPPYPTHEDVCCVTLLVGHSWSEPGTFSPCTLGSLHHMPWSSINLDQSKIPKINLCQLNGTVARVSCSDCWASLNTIASPGEMSFSLREKPRIWSKIAEDPALKCPFHSNSQITRPGVLPAGQLVPSIPSASQCLRSVFDYLLQKYTPNNFLQNPKTFIGTCVHVYNCIVIT